jgi:hypothetical protein
MEGMEDGSVSVPAVMWSDGTLDSEIEDIFSRYGPLNEGTVTM